MEKPKIDLSLIIGENGNPRNFTDMKIVNKAHEEIQGLRQLIWEGEAAPNLEKKFETLGLEYDNKMNSEELLELMDQIDLNLMDSRVFIRTKKNNGIGHFDDTTKYENGFDPTLLSIKADLSILTGNQKIDISELSEPDITLLHDEITRLRELIWTEANNEFGDKLRADGISFTSGKTKEEYLKILSLLDLKTIEIKKAKETEQNIQSSLYRHGQTATISAISPVELKDMIPPEPAENASAEENKMYVIRFGKPFDIEDTFDNEIIEKYQNMYPEKAKRWETATASFFADQDFIKFILSELDNGYKLETDSCFEIIEYDASKGHPILVEFSGEYDVNLFDFENAILWSNSQKTLDFYDKKTRQLCKSKNSNDTMLETPKYCNLYKSYWFFYDPEYIDQIQSDKIHSHDQLDDKVIGSRFILDGIPHEEFDNAHITTPEKFGRLISLTQQHILDGINPKSIITNSIYVEGTKRIEKRKQHEKDTQEHKFKVDPNKVYISFGTSLEEHQHSGIKPIENTPNIKPTGGLWACSYSPEAYNHSEWETFCRSENYLDENYLKKGIKFTIKEDAKLLRLETKEDVEYLFTAFKKMIGYNPSVDFEKVSRLYSGVYVSETAQHMLDFWNLNDSRAIPKPFCVPGIVAFSSDILANLQDFDYEKENNQIITITNTLTNALGSNISLTHSDIKQIEAGKEGDTKENIDGGEYNGQ